jgi:hypothetical protein
MSIIFLQLSDLNDVQVKVDLPFLQKGEKIHLNFCIERLHLGRREVLNVQGEFLVLSAIKHIGKGRSYQVVQVSSTGKAPSWKAVKKLPGAKLFPAKSKPVLIE